MSSAQVREAITESGVIGILRSSAQVDLVTVCRALLRGGLPVLEITLNSPGALDAIAKLSKELSGELTIGAGTILAPADAEAAISAGAQFIVTPTLQTDTIAVCREHGRPIVCGAMTPTEMLTAHRAGADYVKLFPAGSLGLEYIRAVLAPMPFLKIVPTGGVTLANVESFLSSGLPAVAVGSNLADPKLILQQRWDDLTDLARQFAQAAERGMEARS